MKFLLFLFLSCISVWGQSSLISLTADEKDFIKKHPNITLGVDATWAPYVFVKNGKVIDGYEYEIIQKINGILGTNITIVPGVWNDIVTQAKNEKLYGLSVSVASKERAKYFEFTNPNVIIRNNIIVREGNPQNIRSLKDLQGKVIAIQKDNGFQRNRVKHIQGATIVEFDDYKEFNKFLTQNHVDAIPMSDASLYTLKALDIPFNTILYLEDDKEGEIVFSINKKYSELTSIINKALAVIAEEEKTRLREKWLFSPIVYENMKKEMIILNEYEKYFLSKKPRITIGIPKEILKEKANINQLTIETANNIFDVSGLRIDFKIASRYRLLRDIKENKIKGMVSHTHICDETTNYLCSKTYLYDDAMVYNFTLRKEQKELLSIIDKSLYSLYIQSNHKSFLSQEERKYLFHNNTIRFCIDPFSPPFEELKDGKHMGAGADILKVLSESMKVSFKLVETKNWSGSLEYIKDKRCDILPFTGKSESRLSYMNFTDMVYEYALIIVTKNNVSFIKDIGNLKNHTIGIRKDYAIHETLKNKYPHLSIIAVETNKEGLHKVQNGELFAFLGSVPSLGNLIQEKYLGELKISGTINNKSLLYMGVAKDKEMLLNILNKALAYMPSGVKQSIMTKWSSFIYEDNLKYVTILKIVIGILCVSVLAVFFFIYRQFLLRKYNHKLKKEITQEQEKNEKQTSQLLQQSKLAQIGEMTNIIAHQWRQPLSAISATTNNLVFKLALEEKIQKEKLLEEIELISTYSQHLSCTISDFRSFFRNDNICEEVELDLLINNVIKIIHPSLKEHNITLEKNGVENLSLTTYKNEIQQAILSIIQNAKDAIREKYISNGEIIITLTKIDQNVEIEIFNNGGNIDDEIIDQIFEPSFTTKKDTGGTGIGLYISKMIVESHCNGKLTVENKEEGVSFKITLPLA